MGALALLMTGVIGILVLQSRDSNSDVASVEKTKEVSERPVGMNGASSEGDGASIDLNSNKPAANSAANVAMPTPSADSGSKNPSAPAAASDSSAPPATGPMGGEKSGESLDDSKSAKDEVKEDKPAMKK